MSPPLSVRVIRWMFQSRLEGPAVASAPPSGVGPIPPNDEVSTVLVAPVTRERAVSAASVPPRTKEGFPIRSWSPTTASSWASVLVRAVGSVPGPASTRIAFQSATSQRSLKASCGVASSPVT
ncbi:hypothetical protein KEF29_09510 [Streptomyces tuirus]|uniref:Uncharacterized protein n=1 Tax=Streptomyces tuirus TaxID=68278 RepID=A0A941J216_9ACTN|nr:hypothetical protein [Streptomyces tuirus]